MVHTYASEMPDTPGQLPLPEHTAAGGLVSAEDFSTDHLAEQLPYDALQICLNYRRHESRSDQDDFARAQTDLELAWLELESAMSTPEDDIARDHFEDSLAYAGRVLANSVRCAEQHVSARRLQAYHSRLRERRSGHPHRDGSRRAMLAKTAECLEEVDDFTIHSTRDEEHFEEGHLPCFGALEIKSAARIKLATELLLMRAGVDVYGASLREGGYFMGRDLVPSHDGYIIDKEVGKMPYRARYGRPESNRRGDKGNLIIPYGGLAKYALDEIGVDVRSNNLNDYVGETIGLLALDARDKNLLQSEDRRLLGCMTDRILLILEEHQEDLVQHSIV